MVRLPGTVLLWQEEYTKPYICSVTHAQSNPEVYVDMRRTKPEYNCRMMHAGCVNIDLETNLFKLPHQGVGKYIVHAYDRDIWYE